MAPFFWSRWLRSLQRPRRPQPYRRPAARPLVEPLEPRLPPATFTWTGKDGSNWSDRLNWVGDVAPTGSPTTLDDLVFQTGAAQKSTNNDLPLVNGVAPTFNSITVNDSSYSFSGNAVILGNLSALGSGVVTLAPLAAGVTMSFNIQLAGPAGDRQLFTINQGADLTLSGHLSGTTGAQLVKEGSGLLVLGNDNSGFTGLITVDTNGGILRITNANALGDTTSPTVIQQNGQLQVANVTGTINENLILNGPGAANDGALLNYSGNNTWAGNIALDSDVTLGANSGTSLDVTGQISDLGGDGFSIIKEGAGQFIFASANTYRGTTTVNNGVLTIEDPLALGSAVNGTFVNVNTITHEVGQLRLFDPTGVGFIVLDEQLTINDGGGDGNGSLYNVQGNNDWAGSIILSGTSPYGQQTAPSIGTAANTTLTIDGVISDAVTGNPFGFSSLTKVGPGRLKLTNHNTYVAGTTVAAGYLTITDSQALGTGGVFVVGQAALELAVDSGFDPHGRNLGLDSVTGLSNELSVGNELTLNGSGPGGVGGALDSVSGINTWTGPIFLDIAAGIGVQPDPNPSNSGLYFTEDYSLTVGGNIAGSSLLKLGTGQLILPFGNSYSGTTEIQQGWITIETAGSLGAGQPDPPVSDLLQPAVTVDNGAALMLRPQTATDHIDLIRNLILTGNGITHPFPLISQRGALISLGGDNTIGGSPDANYSNIKLNGNVGIGVEWLAPFASSSLTVTNTILNNPGTTGALTKLGPQRLTLLGEDDYTGPTTIAEGVLRAENNNALGLASTGTNNAAGTETYTTTTTTVAPGQDAIQDFTISGQAATFTLSFNGQTTPALPYNVDPGTVQADLNALSTIGGAGGSVTVNQSGNNYTVTFGGSFQGVNQPLLVGTGQNGTVVTVTTVQVGDGTALELQDVPTLYNGGITEGLNTWNENLVLNSPGNATFGLDSLNVLGSDMMWRGGISLSSSSTLNVPSGSRLTVYGVIDDANNPSPSGSNLSIAGGGTLLLAASNTYRGTTVVNGGASLQVANSQALGAAPTADVQTLSLTGSTSGTFTLTFNGSTTGTLNAASPTLASDVQTALNALPSVVKAGGTVTVAPQSATFYTITFGGNLLGFDQPQMTATGAGGTVATPGTLVDGAGGVVVADGSALELQGNLVVAGKPLQLQGDGRLQAANIATQWFSVGPSPSNNGNTAGNQAVTGRVTGVVVDYDNPAIIYVSTAAGGVWKTYNGGQTWLQLLDLQNGRDAIQTVTVGGSSTGTFTLSFFGATTAPLNAGSLTLASDIESALDALPTIGGAGGIVTVSQERANPSNYDVTFGDNLSGVNEPLLIAIPSGGTTATVTALQSGMPSNLPMYVGTIAIDPNNPRILYIGTGETNNSGDSYYGTGIYKSIDGGFHWT